MTDLKDLRESLRQFAEDEKNSDNETDKSMYRQLKEITANKIKALIETEVKPRIESSGLIQDKKSIENHLKTIPRFTGTTPEETERFIDRLRQAHEALVKGKNPELEVVFLTHSKLLLDISISKHLHSGGKEIDSFEKLKTFLTEQYGPKVNSCQLLTKIFDEDFDVNGQISVFATRISELTKVAYSAVNAQYKRVHKCQTDIPAEDAMQFVAATVVANNVRGHNYALWHDMIRELDDCLTPHEVANKAEYYSQRLNESGASSTFFGRNRNGRNKTSRNGGGNSGNNRSRNGGHNSGRDNPQIAQNHSGGNDNREYHNDNGNRNGNRIGNRNGNRGGKRNNNRNGNRRTGRGDNEGYKGNQDNSSKPDNSGQRKSFKTTEESDKKNMQAKQESSNQGRNSSTYVTAGDHNDESEILCGASFR